MGVLFWATSSSLLKWTPCSKHKQTANDKEQIRKMREKILKAKKEQ